MTHFAESDLLQGLIDAALVGSWLVHHDRPARTSEGWATAIQGHAGFPDIIAVHPERHQLLVLECKSATGRTTPLQDAWLDALRACGVDARVVRPDSYDELWRQLVGERLVKARSWRSHPENDEP
jgi:hypothetical protein